MTHASGTSDVADATRLKPGFADPVFEAQAAFRAVLNAMSYAGRVYEFKTDLDPPGPFAAATAAIALTLFDFDNAVWLDGASADGPVPAFLRFHCGTRLCRDPIEARFAVIADPSIMPALDSFAIGEDRYPDRSATLIIQVPSLTEGPATSWTGPGIESSLEVRIAGLSADFWEQWALNHELYPLGVDILFTAASSVIGLPRSVKVED
ncbi:MAG: phosphonate C-P lyase system protein PhnH [Gammaproteobacteria bacterium]